MKTEKIRKGRSVTAIKFIVKDKKQVLMDKDVGEVLYAEVKDVEVDEDQISFPGTEATPSPIDDPHDPLALCADALPREFSREQVELLRSLAIDHLPYEIFSVEEKEMWLHEYLYKKTLLMKATPNVMSPFAWLRQAVAEDWR